LKIEAAFQRENEVIYLELRVNNQTAGELRVKLKIMINLIGVHTEVQSELLWHYLRRSDFSIFQCSSRRD
jgi:hypothetical protein